VVVWRTEEEYCRRGSVTNIVNEKTKGLADSEYGATRDLAVQLKKEGLSFVELASIYRRHNYVNKLGANEEEVESLVANLLDGARSIPQEIIADLMNQLFELSKSENIPPKEVPAYINQKIEEKKRLEDEIQKSRAILDQECVDIQTIEGHKKMMKELKKYGLSTEAPHKLVSVLQSFNEMGFDPQRIVTYYKQTKSLKQKEWRLRNYCKLWESRAAEYQKIIPMCKHVVSMGIGYSLTSGT
jgi:hypothetical protein